jgi:hypothetical protein
MSSFMFLATVVITLEVIFGAIVVRIAKKKGLNIPFWTVWGYSFGPLILPVVLLAPDKSKKREAFDS